jgi:cytochrome b6
MPNDPVAGAASPEASAGRGALWNWLDERFDLAAVERFARHKEVPVGKHSLFWYFLGGLTFFFFVVQILSGILLLMYYQAGESTSYESMRFIVTKVPFGWLVRAIHCWSAHLMILTLLFHMWSVFFLRAYRKPRELTWFTGIALFGLSLGFGFSGYLLPWNELAFFATAVGTDSVKAIPIVGEWMLRVMRGGDEVSIHTLYRFYALHVCVLPIAAFSVIGVHLLFVQKQGMAEAIPVPESERPQPKPGQPSGMPFFPNFVLRDLLLWILALNLLALLAVLLPYGPGVPGFEWELGHKADLLKPAYPGIKPEWYFLWMYQLLKEFPPHVFGMEGPRACLLLATLLMGVWTFVPFLDRRAGQNRPGPAFTDFGVGVLYVLGFLMLKAWDVGAPHVEHGVDPTATPAAARLVARTAATWLLGAATAVTLARALVRKHRYFWIGALPVLQAVLHGFAGLSYLMAGAVCVGLLAVVLATTWRRSRAVTAALVMILALWCGGGGALAQESPATGSSLPPSSWPAEFKSLIESEAGGHRIVSELARAHFQDLPSYAQEKFFAAQKGGLLDSAEQLDTLLELEITDENVELLVGDNCVLCHTNPNNQSDETLFRRREAGDPNPHLDIREVVSDVHMRRGLACSGCHGGKPTDESMSDEIFSRWPDREHRRADRAWIPNFCTQACHSQPGFMRRFNPALPIDQMLKYRESRHGIALLTRHNERAAQCVSCHGVHGIRRPSSPKSKVYPANVPATCGGCHANAATMSGAKLDDGKTPLPTDQLEKYVQSVHGKALLEKHDLGAPACNDCHGNHAAMPPAVASVSQICRNCHVNNGKLFDGSPHKAAFEKHGWPECEVCHGKHDIANVSDAMLGTGPGNVCKTCHDQFARPECNEIAQHFHDEIVRIERERDEATVAVAAAEERGLDLSDVRFELVGVGDVLVEARSKIHAFNRAEFDKTAKKGLTTLEAARNTTSEAIREHRFRKVGLVVSTLFVTLLAGLLLFRIRGLDRRT